MVEIFIDGTKIEARENQNILTAAREANIYIPSLCFHEDLPPAKGLKPVDAVFSGGSKI